MRIRHSHFIVIVLCNILSDERIGLSFTIAAGPRQRIHSQVRVPQDSSHFTVSDSRLPQPGEPGPGIYIRQEQGRPLLAPGTGFPFRRLLLLAGLRWRYSTPPPHPFWLDWFLIYDWTRSGSIGNASSLVNNACLLARYLVMDIYESHRKCLFCCQECLFIGPLPSNRSTCHNILTQRVRLRVSRRSCSIPDGRVAQMWLSNMRQAVG
jgi:hypothetical protein